MNFEENMQQLLAVTAQLEQGGLSLEDAVKLYGEGARLAADCKKELEQAKLKVTEFEQKTENQTNEGKEV